MKNLKIGKKLLLGFGFLIVVIVLVTAFGTINMISMDANYSHLLNPPFERYAAASVIETRFMDMRRAQNRAAMYMNDPDDPIGGINQQEAEFRAILSETMSAIESYRHFVDIDDALTSQMKSDLNDRMTVLEDAVNSFVNDFAYALFEAARNAVLAETAEERGIHEEEMLRLVRGTSVPVDRGSEALDYLFYSARDFMDTNSDEITAQSRTMIITLVIVAVTSIVVAILLAIYISGIISRPLVALEGFMQTAAKTGKITMEGNEKATIEKFARNKDETGRCLAAVSSFMEEINHEMDTLERIGEGDLTITPNILSEEDKVGKALTLVVDSLNRMFAEIYTSTSQVSAGSRQIADGAQSLAQGSTEQAAAVQQLSASMTTIAQKTKENSDMASRAATLANNIKTNAEKGSGQMAEMMNAVKDINESSHNISKVIKSIDEIAFQTNILALNAAVEAARAGQHGKGFAVVAEEVRTLASKSAEAAKDTESLIADSISKAELGSKIANETSESLTEIVAGIGESSRIVGEIAKSSEDQTTSIEQINTGIDQVAQVTQQNSATAEQSAAASEEMSGQSTMLEQLLSQFKLKDTQGMGQLPLAMPQLSDAAADGNEELGVFDSPGGFGKY